MQIFLATQEQLKDALRAILMEMEKERGVASSEAKSQAPTLLTCEQLSQVLNKSRQTIYNWTKSGIITPHKVERSVFYDLDEVNASIRRMQRATKSAN